MKIEIFNNIVIVSTLGLCLQFGHFKFVLGVLLGAILLAIAKK